MRRPTAGDWASDLVQLHAEITRLGAVIGCPSSNRSASEVSLQLQPLCRMLSLIQRSVPLT